MPTVYVDYRPPSYLDQIKSTVRHWPPAPRMPVHTFPILQWLPKYNLTWLSGDLVCAITLGTIVIPQSMAYAKLAGFPPQYGLYSSFVGTVLYPFLGTSKDISIGTTAIMSLLVGQVVAGFMQYPEFLSGEWTLHDFAITLALFAGIICTGLAFLRLGILFRFISQPAIAGFMAGSGLTIFINQIPKMLGISNIPTTDMPYLIFGKTLINLPHTEIDAVFGILSLGSLYGVRYLAQYLTRRYPQYTRALFFVSISRNAVVIIFTTLLSYMINHFGKFETSPFHILGPVPSGFQMMGVPKIKTSLLSSMMTDIPSIVVLLIMEHCAIAVSLGKKSDYKIDVNQEILSIGLTNIFGSFFSAYPSTGSFCRSAVAAKSGARTPLSNIVVGAIVVLALYALTPAFQYIPLASLAAVIAHAVSDLIVGPKAWIRYWKLDPSELLVFACAYVISLFARVDISVYVPVALSLVVQLYRTAQPSYAVLGKIAVTPDPQLSNEKKEPPVDQFLFFPFTHPTLGHYVSPIGHGIVCFQPRENLVFENACYLMDRLVDEVKLATRRGESLSEKMGDRPWNEVGGSEKKACNKPPLKAVVLDLSLVYQMDYSALEELKERVVLLERYSGRAVSWYIVVSESITVRKCLLLAGFGQQRRSSKPKPFLSDLDEPLPCESRPMDCPKGKAGEEVVTVENVENVPASSNSSDTSDPLPSECDSIDYYHIAAVDDRYPYLFLNLQDAVRAALKNCEFDDIASSADAAVLPNSQPIDEESKPGQ